MTILKLNIKIVHKLIFLMLGVSYILKVGIETLLLITATS